MSLCTVPPSPAARKISFTAAGTPRGTPVKAAQGATPVKGSNRRPPPPPPVAVEFTLDRDGVAAARDAAAWLRRAVGEVMGAQPTATAFVYIWRPAKSADSGADGDAALLAEGGPSALLVRVNLASSGVARVSARAFRGRAPAAAAALLERWRLVVAACAAACVETSVWVPPEPPAESAVALLLSPGADDEEEDDEDDDDEDTSDDGDGDGEVASRRSSNARQEDASAAAAAAEAKGLPSPTRETSLSDERRDFFEGDSDDSDGESGGYDGSFHGGSLFGRSSRPSLDGSDMNLRALREAGRSRWAFGVESDCVWQRGWRRQLPTEGAARRLVEILRTARRAEGWWRAQRLEDYSAPLPHRAAARRRRRRRRRGRRQRRRRRCAAGASSVRGGGARGRAE